MARADIVSLFDTNSEGWSVVDLQQPVSGIPTVDNTYTPTFTLGGNPGESIQYTDQTSDEFFFFASPASFLRDQGPPWA